MPDDLVKRALELLNSYPVRPGTAEPSPTDPEPESEPKLEPLPSDSLVGHLVTWESPLFGDVQALVLEETEMMVEVFHPITERYATIPKSWVIQSSPE